MTEKRIRLTQPKLDVLNDLADKASAHIYVHDPFSGGFDHRHPVLATAKRNTLESLAAAGLIETDSVLISARLLEPAWAAMGRETELRELTAYIEQRRTDASGHSARPVTEDEASAVAARAARVFPDSIVTAGPSRAVMPHEPPPGVVAEPMPMPPKVLGLSAEARRVYGIEAGAVDISADVVRFELTARPADEAHPDFEPLSLTEAVENIKIEFGEAIESLGGPEQAVIEGTVTEVVRNEVGRVTAIDIDTGDKIVTVYPKHLSELLTEAVADTLAAMRVSNKPTTRRGGRSAMLVKQPPPAKRPGGPRPRKVVLTRAERRALGSRTNRRRDTKSYARDYARGATSSQQAAARRAVRV